MLALLVCKNSLLQHSLSFWEIRQNLLSTPLWQEPPYTGVQLGDVTLLTFLNMKEQVGVLYNRHRKRMAVSWVIMCPFQEAAGVYQAVCSPQTCRKNKSKSADTCLQREWLQQQPRQAHEDWPWPFSTWWGWRGARLHYLVLQPLWPGLNELNKYQTRTWHLQGCLTCYLLNAVYKVLSHVAGESE